MEPRLRGGGFVFANLYQIILSSDIYHASNKMEFIWWGEKYFVPYFSIHAFFATLYRDSSLTFGPLSLGWSLMKSPDSRKRVGCFCTSVVLVRHLRSDCHVHQRTVSDCWQGRRHIRWIIESWILSIFLYPYNQMVYDRLSSPVGHYSGDLWSNPWLGAQWWVIWIISHQLG